MADNAELTTADIRTVVQNVMDFDLVANACTAMPLLGFLLAKYGSKEKQGLRIPDDGILASLKIPAIKRRDIASHTWEPIYYTGLPTDDTKTLAWYDTTAANAEVAGTATSPTNRTKRSRWRRTNRETPVLIWKRDLEQVTNAWKSYKANGNRAGVSALAKDVRDLIQLSVTERLINQLKGWNTDLFATTSDTPADATALVWTKQYSLHAMMAATGAIAGVDRDISGGEGFQGHTVTDAVPADVEWLFNYMQYDGLRLARYGIAPKLWLAGSKLFPIFKAQSKEKNLRVYSNEDIPGIPVFGQKQEAICYNGDTWIIHEPNLAAKGLDGATTNTLICLDPEQLVVSWMPNKQFTLSEFDDESKRSGARKALAAVIETELGFWTANPFALGCYFSNVG